MTNIFNRDYQKELFSNLELDKLLDAYISNLIKVLVNTTDNIIKNKEINIFKLKLNIINKYKNISDYLDNISLYELICLNNCYEVLINSNDELALINVYCYINSLLKNYNNKYVKILKPNE